MSPKSEKLAQRIQEIQKLVSGKLGEQDETFQTVFQNLENIADRLKVEKLTVQIVSSNLNSAQALHNFLNTCKAVPESYFRQVLLDKIRSAMSFLLLRRLPSGVIRNVKFISIQGYTKRFHGIMPKFNRFQSLMPIAILNSGKFAILTAPTAPTLTANDCRCAKCCKRAIALL